MTDTDVAADHSIVVDELLFRITVPAETMTARQYVDFPRWLQQIRGVTRVRSGEWRWSEPVWFEVGITGSGARTRRRVLNTLQHNPPRGLAGCTIA